MPRFDVRFPLVVDNLFSVGDSCQQSCARFLATLLYKVQIFKLWSAGVVLLLRTLKVSRSWQRSRIRRWVASE